MLLLVQMVETKLSYHFNTWIHEVPLKPLLTGTTREQCHMLTTALDLRHHFRTITSCQTIWTDSMPAQAANKFQIAMPKQINTMRRMVEWHHHTSVTQVIRLTMEQTSAGSWSEVVKAEFLRVSIKSSREGRHISSDLGNISCKFKATVIKFMISC